MKLKKVDPEWKPSENPKLEVGEVIEITDYNYLVRTQKAVLVDDNGNEIPLPGEAYQCGVCFLKIPGTLLDYTTHVLEKHSPKPKVEAQAEAPVAQPIVEEVSSAPVEPVSAETPAVEEAPATEETTTEEAAKAKRLEALAKARAAKTA